MTDAVEAKEAPEELLEAVTPERRPTRLTRLSTAWRSTRFICRCFSSYVESAGTAELLRSLNTRRRVTTLIVTALMLVLVFWAGFITRAAIKELDNYPKPGELVELPEGAVPYGSSFFTD